MQTADSAEQVVGEEVEGLEVEGNTPEDEGAEGGDGEGHESQEGAEDDGEVEITLGDAAAPAAEEEGTAPEWVRQLRQENRDLKRQLKAKQQSPEAEPEAPKVGPRPKLADYDFDEDKHEAALDEWLKAKKKADDHAAEQSNRQKEAEKEQQKLHASYADAAQKLRVPDFKDAEADVLEALSPTQQGILLAGLKGDAAKMIYALGKYPDELKKLASIANPVEFAFAAARLEQKVKVSTKSKPAPEGGSIGGSTAPRSGGGMQGALDRAREKAAKTGDYTEVNRIRQQMRSK